MGRTAPLSTDDLSALVTDPLSRAHLAEYFDAGEPGSGAGRYTGGRFELLGGGGDRAGIANMMTAEDLLAVALLSIRLPTTVALRLLEGNLGNEVNQQLSEIPTTVRLGEPAAEPLLAKDGAAHSAWSLLDNCGGVGWVTAGKLLARKRPHLIPVYDGVVRCALGKPPSPLAVA